MISNDCELVNFKNPFRDLFVIVRFFDLLFVLQTCFCNGGERGSRTPGEITPTPVFKTGAIDHSAISPHDETWCLLSIDLTAHAILPVMMIRKNHAGVSTALAKWKPYCSTNPESCQFACA
jgi:hypothetical protein